MQVQEYSGQFMILGGNMYKRANIEMYFLKINEKQLQCHFSNFLFFLFLALFQQNLLINPC